MQVFYFQKTTWIFPSFYWTMSEMNHFAAALTWANMVKVLQVFHKIMITLNVINLIFDTAAKTAIFWIQKDVSVETFKSCHQHWFCNSEKALEIYTEWHMEVTWTRKHKTIAKMRTDN